MATRGMCLLDEANKSKGMVVMGATECEQPEGACGIALGLVDPSVRQISEGDGS